MAKRLKVAVEVGPKGKKAAAWATEWPGLERGGKTPDEAVATLEAYVPRYLRVAKLARLGTEFSALSGIQVVERYEGVGSTDFWGISFAFSDIDRAPLAARALQRELRLLRACWRYFDDVRARVSAEMRKGPRGGGRDRDRIVRHVLGVEQDWAKKLGLAMPKERVITDSAGIAAFRDDYCDAIVELGAQRKTARSWPLHYLVRHTAYHAMDHAWEMEDKDLNGGGATAPA